MRVSGRMKGENLDILREMLEPGTSEVVIDLREVILVDREVITFLAASEESGIGFRNCPGYIREWIDREKQQG